MTDQDEPRVDRRSGISISMQDYVEALIEPVAQRIRAGDVTLREYLERILQEHQEQVQRLLEQADTLELARIAALEVQADERWSRVEEQMTAVTDRAARTVEQLRRERELVTAAQTEAIRKAEEATKLAIEKAEIATDKRFESVNEFRSAQGDIINRFLPREVADAQFAEIRRAVADLTEKLSKIA